MEDKEIVQLYWDRDERAISESDGKYGPLCRSVAMRVLEHREDSEECVSDTWLRSWNAIPPKRPDPLGPFLAKITRNLALDRWRKDHAAKRYAGETVLVLEELEEAKRRASVSDLGLQHTPSWYCGRCLSYCPAGNWGKKFKSRGLSQGYRKDRLYSE